METGVSFKDYGKPHLHVYVSEDVFDLWNLSIMDILGSTPPPHINEIKAYMCN